MSELLEISFPGGKRVDVQVGGFDIGTDQSVKNGGEASAPAPFTLFLASLASCSGIYALNFCQTRKLPTDGLSLTMEWEGGGKSPANAIPACGCGYQMVFQTATAPALSRRWIFARSKNRCWSHQPSRSNWKTEVAPGGPGCPSAQRRLQRSHPPSSKMPAIDEPARDARAGKPALPAESGGAGQDHQPVGFQ